MSEALPPAASAAMLAILQAAARRRYSVTRMKLAKLLYLCDLEAVRAGQKPFTGVTWKWLNYGPYSYALKDLEEELVEDGSVERRTTNNFYGSVEYQLRPLVAVPDIDETAQAIVEAVMDRYGMLAPSSLKDETYQTEPMVTAQERGERGVVLDLLEARPVPDIAPALGVLRKVRDRLGDGSTDPEVWEEIQADNAALSRARRSASTRLLEE